jgi:hypothetical protein
MSAEYLDADHAALLTRHNMATVGKLFTIGGLLEQVARAASRLA